MTTAIEEEKETTQQKRGPGRPKGSKNKTNKPGRPKGSKNKPGRPKGSKNKTTKTEIKTDSPQKLIDELQNLDKKRETIIKKSRKVISNLIDKIATTQNNTEKQDKKLMALLKDVKQFAS